MTTGSTGEARLILKTVFILVQLLLAVLLIGLILWWLQPQMLFLPLDQFYATPVDWG